MEYQEPEESAVDVREGILALLGCSDESLLFEEEDKSVEERQEYLCSSLLQAVQRSNKMPHEEILVPKDTKGHSQFIRTSIADYNNKSEQNEDSDGLTTASIRELLGNLPSATMTKIAPLLSSLLTNRVDVSDLLPATQDDRANEEAMGKAAITITKLSLVAAQLYVELIGIPGAWGSGLIDVGAISSLSALIRRWCLECRGREPMEEKKLEASKRKSKARKAPPAKRSRKSHRKVVAVIDDDSDETSIDSSDDSSMDTEFDIFASDADQDGTPLSTEQLIWGGLRIALSLAKVTRQKEFMNWSGEAREALLDSIITSLATTSALVSAASHKNDMMSMGKLVEVSLSESLQEWVMDSTSNVGESDHNEQSAHIRKQHKTSVFLLRGLLPVLSMQIELPNGHRGREAAIRVAVSTLEGFIQSAASECSKWSMVSQNCHILRSLTTPMAANSNRKVRQGTYSDVSTPKTGNKERKKRISFGMSSDEGAVPPTLKKSCTPRRSRSRLSIGNYTPTQQEGEPRPILSAVLGMFQKLTTSKGLEKANVRARIITTLQQCLPRLPHLERSYFLRFLIQLCHSKISVHRLLGVEIIGKIISEAWFWKDHGSSQVLPPDAMRSASKSPSHRLSLSPLVERSLENMPFALIGAIHGRLADKVPTVRARSAFSLADTFRTFSDGDVDMKIGDESWTTFEEAISSTATDMLVCLRKRASRDERATVRKASISAMVELLVLGETTVLGDNNGLYISETDISILSRLCADQSVSTRKAAADALSTLLQKCYYAGYCSVEAAIALEYAWASAVLPLVLDVESSCVGKAVDLFSTIVIDPLVEVGGRVMEWNNDAQKRRYMTAWRILAHASENSRQQGAARGEAGSLRAVLKKLLNESGSDEKSLKRSLLKEIRRVAVETLEVESQFAEIEKSLFQDDIEAQRIGSWCLFDAFVDIHSANLPSLAQVTKKSSIDMKFLSTSWDTMHQLSQSPTTPKHCVASLQESMRSCLRVLSRLALLLDENDSQASSDRLKELLGSFGLVPDLVGSAISALVALTQKSCPDAVRTKRECSLWIRELYQKCQGEIESFVSKARNGMSQVSEVKKMCLVRALFTIGELSIVGFRADEESSLFEETKVEDATSRCNSVVGLYEPPPKKLLFLLQTMLATQLPGSEDGSASAYPTPHAARAHAFSTLGKLCLRDEALAKDSLTIFARELHQNKTEQSPSVQSNALLVLSDLCVKYTNLVDRYLPVMAACLQSGYTSTAPTIANESTDSPVASSALVRRHAILTLSGLLLQDYLKWRGLLFHRFLVASADEDEGVAKLAEMTLCGPLLQKYPKLFFNNFVEALFVLNRCTAHPIYTAAAMMGDNGGGVAVGFDGIYFSGSSGRARRLQMYEMMLSKMTDEEKIGVTARLAKDVLGGALESDGDLSRVCTHPPRLISPSNETRGDASEESALNVLSDAFSVLTSPNIRVVRVSNDDDEIHDQPKSNQLVVAAKDRLLSKISRKHLIEIVLPILCNLKAVLQESCSPLLKELMIYLVEIFRAYKSEVKEFLANDPTLLQEVEYDATQFRKSFKLQTPSRQEHGEGTTESNN